MFLWTNQPMHKNIKNELASSYGLHKPCVLNMVSVQCCHILNNSYIWPILVIEINGKQQPNSTELPTNPSNMTLYNQCVLKDSIQYNIKVVSSLQGHRIIPALTRWGAHNFLDNSLSAAHSLVSETRRRAHTHAQTSTLTDTK